MFTLDVQGRLKHHLLIRWNRLMRFRQGVSTCTALPDSNMAKPRDRMGESHDGIHVCGVNLNECLEGISQIDIIQIGILRLSPFSVMRRD